MIKRALIIGSEVYGLNGVHNDVDSISSTLAQRGFQNDVRTSHNATRDGILEGYQRLIQDSSPEDAALIYYSGHGGRARNPTYLRDSNSPQYLQFIVPTDFEDSSFQGIMSFELSLLLFKLTNQTRNVVVILDCCHSARMSRGQITATTRSLSRTWTEGIEEFLANSQNNNSLELLDPESNPHALRLVATEADQSAYEYENKEGRKVGILTESLVEVLEKVGNLPVTWKAISMRVRERVMSYFSQQRPEIEGPSQRLLFTTEESPRTGAVVFFYDDGIPSLRAGKILGAQIGAEYGIMPIDANAYNKNQAIAHATITAIEGNFSRVQLQTLSDSQHLVDGSLAYPLRVSFQRRKVCIQGNSEETATLASLIQGSQFLELTEEEPYGGFVVVVNEEELRLLSLGNVMLANPDEANEKGCRRMLSRLERWARAEALRELEDGGLDVQFRVDWGRVINAERFPMSSGDIFPVGDYLYVFFENISDLDLYIAIYDIGISGNITLITGSEPSGIKITSNNTYLLGKGDGPLLGIQAYWPQDLPNDEPHHASLILVVSDERQDFSALETDTIRNVRGESPSQLEQILSQVKTGMLRDFNAEVSRTSGAYTVKKIDFELNPSPR